MIHRGILLQEENLHTGVNRHLYPLSTLVKDLAPLVIFQWHKSNVNFKPPVIIDEISIARKIKSKWEGLVDILNSRTKISVRENIISDLDNFLML